MGKKKSVKDTIHGYIELDEPFWKLVDTPEFQRLKWIEQTSYRILYPSARHDRFIHSLGVFHLGKIAFDSFLGNVMGVIETDKFEKALDDKNLLMIKNSFLFACLFHDIGHAPFSHTLEELFNYGYSVRQKDNIINPLLFAEVNTSKRFNAAEIKKFEVDYDYVLKCSMDETGLSILSPPKVHEIISSLLIIKRIETFNMDKKFSDTISLDLCIRAIMGITFRVSDRATESEKLELGFKNGIIRLLNSNTIDVDKLDYIKRDTIMSGYDNTNIDTVRLLNSLTFIEVNGTFYPAFNKSALSIIDNVIKAKNAQAKWIISHPAVKYEEYLVKQIIDTIASKFIEKNNVSPSDVPQIPCPNATCGRSPECSSYICKYKNKDVFIRKLFSVDALTPEGITILGRKFCLLSDNDIICLMKEFIEAAPINEFFARNKRYKPIWKSPEEFVHLFKKEKFNIIDDVTVLFKSLFKIDPLWKDDKIVISEEHYRYVVGEVEKGNTALEEAYRVLNLLYTFCKEPEIDFDFVVIPAKNNFSTKISEESTYFVFDSERNTYSRYSELFDKSGNIPTLGNFEFFYIYSKQSIDRNDFIEKIYNEFNVGFSYA